MEFKQAELNEVLKQQQNLQQVGPWNHLHDNIVLSYKISSLISCDSVYITVLCTIPNCEGTCFILMHTIASFCAIYHLSAQLENKNTIHYNMYL